MQLRAENEIVTDFDDSLKQIAKEMLLMMYAADGVGLAAPQVRKPANESVCLQSIFIIEIVQYAKVLTCSRIIPGVGTLQCKSALQVLCENIFTSLYLINQSLPDNILKPTRLE